MSLVVDTLAPTEPVRVGGAGNKCLRVAKGISDTYVYPKKGLQHWDLCAPEAIFKGMGCYFTNFM